MKPLKVDLNIVDHAFCILETRSCMYRKTSCIVGSKPQSFSNGRFAKIMGSTIIDKDSDQYVADMPIESHSLWELQTGDGVNKYSGISRRIKWLFW